MHHSEPTSIRFGISGDYFHGALLGLPVDGGIYMGQWKMTFGKGLQVSVGLDADDLRDLANNFQLALDHIRRNGDRSKNAWMLNCRNGLDHVSLGVFDRADRVQMSLNRTHLEVSLEHFVEAIHPLLKLAKVLDDRDREHGVR